MLMSNYSATTNLNGRKTHQVSDAYQKLGLLSQIAKRVRNYKVSRFGGATKDRERVTFDEFSPEVKHTLGFVRQWIERTEDKGLLSYKLAKTIPERKTALKKAQLYLNVQAVKTAYLPHAEEMIRRHLNALQNDSWKVSKNFDRKTFEKHADKFSFDDKALEKFPNDLPSESSIDELPLESEEWLSRMDAVTFDNSEEFKAEQKRKKAQMRAERKVVVAQQPAKRGPGRPRKKQPPPVPVAPIAPPPIVQNKKKRGRPKGSKNKKTLAASAKDVLELKQKQSTFQPGGEAQTQTSSDVADGTGTNAVDDRSLSLSNSLWFSLDFKHSSSRAVATGNGKRIKRVTQALPASQ